MRIYASANRHHVKTVKAQGQRVVDAWKEARALSVEVKAIKRIGNIAPDNQWGFVVLESLFSTYLCHYSYEGTRLTVTPELLLDASHRNYLQCPGSLLAQAETENSRWRDCARTYMAAVKELTADRLAGNVTLFLKKRYETRQYGEPFYVLQKNEGEWFGINCYGERKYLRLSLSDIHDHCPALINVESLKAIDTNALSPECVNTGVLVYRESGDSASILGRPMTRPDIVYASMGFMAPPKFELHGDCIWP